MLRRCRVCGCTDEHGCEGGCTWVADDLCSQCAEEKGMNFWEQLAAFEEYLPGDTLVIVWGPMGQYDEMPLAEVDAFVSAQYDAFDAHNCGLGLVFDEDTGERVKFNFIEVMEG